MNSDRPHTQNLSALPAPAEVRRILKAAAVLDMILCEDWEYRYYNFDAAWGDREELLSMRNGSGDDFRVLFTEHGTIIKGFGHESNKTPWTPDPENPKVHPGVLDAVPAALFKAISDPALEIEATSFCIWRETADNEWKIGPVDFDEAVGISVDGSFDLLHLLDGRPESYQKYATEYFEREDGTFPDVPLDAVKRIYALEPLTQELVSQLNPERKLADMLEELKQADYPVAR